MQTIAQEINLKLARVMLDDIATARIIAEAKKQVVKVTSLFTKKIFSFSDGSLLDFYPSQYAGDKELLGLHNPGV